MRIEQGPRRFRASFGELQVQAVGLTGDLTELSSLHPFMAPPEAESHISGFLTALQAFGISAIHLPLSFADIQTAGEAHPGAALIIDMPLRTEGEDANRYVHALLYAQNGVIQFAFPRDLARLRPDLKTIFLEALTWSPVPDGYTRFEVPLEAAAGRISQLGLAAMPSPAASGQVTMFVLRITQTVKIAGIGNIAANAVALVADRLINKDPGMKWFRKDGDTRFPTMTAQDIQGLAGKKSLVFVHGVISTIDRAFGNVLDDPGTMKHLTGKYAGNMVGFDHYTLSETYIDTAKEFAAVLPVGANIDIVCHSRGASVIRAMLEKSDAQVIFSKKQITVGTVVFVAGANAGTPIANMAHWQVLVNVVSYIASHLPPGVIKALVTFVAVLLKIIIGLASDLDSLTTLDPGAKFYTDLKSVAQSPAKQYVYARADYDLNQLPWALSQLLQGFMTTCDLVIPWDSAGSFYAKAGGKPAVDVLDYNKGPTAQPIVYHTNFFEQPGTLQMLTKIL